MARMATEQAELGWVCGTASLMPPESLSCRQEDSLLSSAPAPGALACSSMKPTKLRPVSAFPIGTRVPDRGVSDVGKMEEAADNPGGVIW